MKLTDAQELALDGMQGWEGADWGVALLEGWAGTGKSTVINRLLEGIGEGGGSVAVCCPTHKALGVIDRVDGVEYTTVHSLLGLRLRQLPGGGSRCEQEGSSRVHEFDLVIVDEASMVGGMLFELLINPNERQGCRVIFVGDSCQLSPVDDDRSPVFDLVQKRWVLTDVVRQARGNPIIEASIGIRAAIEAGERVDIGAVADVLAGSKVAGVMGGGAVSIVREAVAAHERGDDFRVLAFRNATVERYNAAIHRGIYGADAGLFEAGQTVVMQDQYKVGARRYLRNSQELIVRSIDDGGERHGVQCVMLSFNEAQRVPVPVDRPAMNARVSALFREYRLTREPAKNKEAWAMINGFANVRHGYASTVHKSQGSTYGTVLLDWQDVRGIQSSAEFSRAVYVAVTRSSERLAVGVVG